VDVRDPAEAASAAAASLRARGATVVVALVHVGGTPDTKKVLNGATGIDWAVLGHSAMNLEEPARIGQTRVLEAMSLGRNLGRLDLHVVAGDGSGPWAAGGARAQLQTILQDHRRQIAEYEQRLPATQEASLKQYYQQRLTDLREAVERETRELTAMPPHVSGNWYENRIIPLDTSVPDQAGVGAMIAAYNRESERLAAAGKPVGIKPLQPGAPPAPAHAGPPDGAPKPTASYVGTEACTRCHQAAADQWQTTKHAHALATLDKAKRGKSPECVPCHVTGYLQPGGTTDLAAAAKQFANVGCESCHGAGSTHVELAGALAKAGSPQALAIAKSAIARKVPETVCLGCHTPDQTNQGFDYAAFLPAVLGPGHGK
jgi:hypothetical protein